MSIPCPSPDYRLKLTARRASREGLQRPEVGPTNQRGGKMLPEKQKRAYKAFYDSARHNESLDEKTTLLIHLAAAFALGCYP